MNFKIAPVVMAIIQALYKGGLEQFLEDGGGFVFLPVRNGEIVLLHPDLPPEILKSCREYAKDFKCTFHSVTEPNFKGLDTESVLEDFVMRIKDLPGAKNLWVEWNVVCATVKTASKDSMDLNELKKALAVTPGLVRGIILHGQDSIIRIEQSPPPLKAHTVMRDKIIDAEAISDLKILLNSGEQDVQTIIDKL